MLRGNRSGIRGTNRQIRGCGGVLVEAVEARMLLSGTPVPPVWAGEFPGPGGSSVTSPVVTTVDHKNGDTLVAYQINEPDSGTAGGHGDLVIAAFKSDGYGGLTLDTTFGGESNDLTNIAATPGYEVVDLNQLLGVLPSYDNFPGGLTIYPYCVGISVEYAGGAGSGNVDLLFGTSLDSLAGEGGRNFGLLQLRGSGTGDSLGMLNTAFGNTFGALAADGSNYDGNFGGGGAEIIGIASNGVGGIGNVVTGNAVAYDSFSNNGAGDILVAGAIGDPYGRSSWAINDPNRADGGAVSGFDSATGAFDGNFGSLAGGAWLLHDSTYPNSPDPWDSEGEGDTICVDPSDGNIYVAGPVLDSGVSQGVPDTYGNFVASLESDGTEGSFYTISALPTPSGALEDWQEGAQFASSVGIQVLSNSEVVAGFGGSTTEAGSGVSLWRLNAALTQTTALWSGGPGDLWVSGANSGDFEGIAVPPAQMAVNAANGDVALMASNPPGSSYPEAIWISGTTGTQEVLSDPYGNVWGRIFAAPVFHPDGSLTIGGEVPASGSMPNLFRASKNGPCFA